VFKKRSMVKLLMDAGPVTNDDAMIASGDG
jgi:hypothetical protein